MYVNIKGSKTDPFRVGTVITIPSMASTLCPVLAMLRYIIHARKTGPLFTFISGTYLTREHVQDIFARYLGNSVNINTHSLRIGGATLLSKVGVPEHVIQKIGRWSSECYKKYVRLADKHITAAYNAIEQFVNV